MERVSEIYMTHLNKYFNLKSYDYIKSYKGESDNLFLTEAFELKIDELLQESYDKSEYIGETIERYSKDILRKYINSIQLRNFYAYIMREMIRNVYEHSNAKKSYLLMYKNNFKELGFKVIDNGIGLRKSLNINPNYTTITDNLTAVTVAIKPGITRAYKRDPLRDEVWQNSGFGLYMISSICNRYGTFQLASGNAEVTINNFTDYSKFKKNKINGTEVTVSVKLDMINNIPEILKEISQQGHAVAERTDISQIKTASQASTLISD